MAEKTRAEFKADLVTTFADNALQQIIASDLRRTFEDIIDSSLLAEDLTEKLIIDSPDTRSWRINVDNAGVLGTMPVHGIGGMIIGTTFEVG